MLSSSSCHKSSHWLGNQAEWPLISLTLGESIIRKVRRETMSVFLLHLQPSPSPTLTSISLHLCHGGDTWFALPRHRCKVRPFWKPLTTHVRLSLVVSSVGSEVRDEKCVPTRLEICQPSVICLEKNSPLLLKDIFCLGSSATRVAKYQIQGSPCPLTVSKSIVAPPEGALAFIQVRVLLQGTGSYSFS